MKSKTKTSTSEGEELAGQYEARQQVRVERAQLMSLEQAAPDVTRHTEELYGGALSAASLDELPPATDNGTKTSSSELATLASKYLDIGALDHTDVENVRRLAASVLSQAAPK